MPLFSRKGPSGFSSPSTAEEVTQGIDGAGLTAIVTGFRLGKNCTVAISVLTYKTWKGNHLFCKSRCRVPSVIVYYFPMVTANTGASSGIGTETTRVLALRGVHVIMAVRNLASGRDVKEAIVTENPHAKVDVMELDLCAMASVRNFVKDFNSKGLPLNLLINNAGILAPPFMLSEDNIELQFATNHIGHFLLTTLLLDNMKKTAQKSNREGRIVNVSSEGHRLSYREGIRFDSINDQSGYSSFCAYGQSKLANILHANELARQLKEDGVNITANSLHPGAILTNLTRYNAILRAFSWFEVAFTNTIGRFVLKNIQQGAATTCYVALHPQVQGISGEYFSDSNLAKTNAQGRDANLAKKLWDFSMDLIK